MPGPGPPGPPELTAGLRALGIRPGADLLIHCSLRQLGRSVSGPAELLGALQVATDGQSTLVVPAQTTFNSVTSRAFHTATTGMTAAETARYIESIPGFDPAVTPSDGMGAFAEYVRRHPGSHRSTHPQTSFAALGPRAAECTAAHDLDCHLGERSPLGWLYQARAGILMLGTTYSTCTAFHLAEYRTGQQGSRSYRCFTTTQGSRADHVFTAPELCDSDFGLLGKSIDREPFVRHGQVGAARAILLPFRAAVDFAENWMRASRPAAILQKEAEPLSVLPGGWVR